MLIHAHAVCKTFPTKRGPITAVDKIDLAVGAGEQLAIVGRSGSGKSTLLAMLGGLSRPTGGTITVDGLDLASLSPRRLADFRAGRFGYLFQFGGLLPNLRAADNVALPFLLSGGREDQASTRARDLLEQVGLRHRWDAYPGELSGGQQRRVALARALVNKPAVLLADEPTNDLDEDAEREVFALLQQLHRENGTTLIVVTHNRELAKTADRVVTLRSGKIVAEERPSPGASVLIAAKHDASGSPITEKTEPFEPAPDALAPAEPEPVGEGLGRFILGFAGWALFVAMGLYAANALTAKVQRQSIETKAAERKRAEELALQQLRADVSEMAAKPDGRYEATLALQNFQADKPLYVLGPSVRVFVQIDRQWQPVPVVDEGNFSDQLHKIADRQTFRAAFRADFPRFDELIGGYMHVRIANVMVVSESPEPTGDLFERTDDYYVYLKPANLSDNEVRRRNGWKPGSLVPRWIPMPAH